MGEARDDFRNVRRGNRGYRQAVGAAIVFPLAAEDDLEMRHGVAGHLAADAVESEVRHVMLAAQLLKQPLILIYSLSTDCASDGSSGNRRVRNSAPRPRDELMPSLQVSVPGQVTMSVIPPAPAAPKPAALSAS